jgi:PAS domain S-box-containing protein
MLRFDALLFPIFILEAITRYGMERWSIMLVVKSKLRNIHPIASENLSEPWAEPEASMAENETLQDKYGSSLLPGYETPHQKSPEESFHALIEFSQQMGDAVVMLRHKEGDEDIQVFVSDTWAKITGYAKEELIGRPFVELITPGERSDYRARYGQNISKCPGGARCQVPILRKDGNEIIIEISYARNLGDPPTQILYLRDITKIARSEQELRDSEYKYRSLFEHSSMAILECDFTEIKHYFDKLRLKGISAKSFKPYLRKHMEEAFDVLARSKPPRYNDAAVKLFEGTEDYGFNAGQPRFVASLHSKGFFNQVLKTWMALYKGALESQHEGVITTFKNNTKHVQVGYSIPQGNAINWSTIFVFHSDITKLKKREKQMEKNQRLLSALSMKLITGQEEERLRIARDIHDQLIQDIVALRMELSLLHDRTDDSKLRIQLNQSLDALAHVVDTARDIIKDLRPQFLDETGLVKAIQYYAIDFQRRSGISCSVNAPGESFQEITVGKAIRIVAYRIVQEALTNVRLHSQATQVDILIETTKDILHIGVHDNGIGIPIEYVDDKSNIGILGMRERAFTVGGSVEIDSSRCQGTTVRISLPLTDMEGNDSFD